MSDIPWWRNYPLLIAGMALAVSTLTSYVTWSGNIKKDIHDQQLQLANITQSIADLDLRSFELLNKYKDNSRAQTAIQELLFSQMVTLLHNASEIATRLGNDSIPSALVTIAQKNLYAGNITEGRRLLEIAYANSRTPTEEWAVLRNLGHVMIRWGNSPKLKEQGNSYFLKALTLDTKYPETMETKGAAEALKAATESDRANALAPVNCKDAQNHFIAFTKYLWEMIPSAEKDRLSKIAIDTRIQGIGGIKECMPLAS